MVDMTEALVNDEGSVSNIVEENVMAVEDEINKNVATLTSSFDSDIVGVEMKGNNEDFVQTGRLETREEMQIQIADENMISFATDTKESAAETSITFPVIFKEGCKRVVYSRSELEAHRNVRVKEQKEKWHEIYDGLGPDVSSEYDSMANSVNKKLNPPNYKSQGQPSGRRDTTTMTKMNHVSEVKSISNSSRDGNWREDSSRGLDEEYSQDSDSDEEYDGILKPAFHVHGKPNFDSGPPEDGMEYLRRVRWEASKIPKVKVAKLDRSKVNNNNQSDYMPKIPDIAKCPDHLLPSKEWEELFLAEFDKLRLTISSSEPSSFSSSDASSGNPTLSAILGMEPVTRISMLRRRISSLNNSDTLSRDNCVWLFALCASVDTPLDADTCASLRCLLRKCASLRAEKTDADDEVVMLNILATIAGKYFRQLDS